MDAQEPTLQTFLPLPSFAHSAHMLDRARLGKQRVECLQLLNALTTAGRGWVNHPAARMWDGHEAALGLYMTFCIKEWERRGYVNTMIQPYNDRWEPNLGSTFASHMAPLDKIVMPPWLGDLAFHAAHRSNLLRKDSDWYGQYGWTEPIDLPYVWPSTEASQ